MADTDLIERLLDPEYAGPLQHCRPYTEIDHLFREAAARIAELIAETHDLGNEICGCNDTIDNLNTQLTASRAECEGLRAALDFYADTSKYPAPFTGGFGELYYDCGQIARAALSRKETGA